MADDDTHSHPQSQLVGAFRAKTLCSRDLKQWKLKLNLNLYSSVGAVRNIFISIYTITTLLVNHFVFENVTKMVKNCMF